MCIHTSMYQKMTHRRGGFTLVEIMIVVAIIAMLASLAIPTFLRARKRAQATATLDTLRLIDSAKDQYAVESGKDAGVLPAPGDLLKYMKTGTKLYTDLANGAAYDNLGRAIAINAIDISPTVAVETKQELAEATGGDAFWGQY